MSDRGLDLERRLRALLAGPAVAAQNPPATPTGDVREYPFDLALLYTITGGVTLRDGTTILGRDEAEKARAWLIEEKSLHWDDALLLLGERDDLVIVRDLDPHGQRAGGGVLEAPTDGLSSFRRVALDVVSYLERHAGDRAAPVSPEVAAQEAMEAGDATSLAAALAAGFYPGAERAEAQASQRLGALRAAAGDEGAALAAFARAVELRVTAAPRGAGPAERAAAWKAAAIAAEKAGASAIAAACKSRATAGEAGK